MKALRPLNLENNNSLVKFQISKLSFGQSENF